ncbi:MAG: hypothetical protein PHR77_03880, partial [Kiritimatiellae bacterium]|nr:hypothetical protein [Kiritimatiellia bacterium]
MPDRNHSFHLPLKQLTIGKWIDFKIPLNELTNRAHCTEIGFHLSESEYKDGDVVDFWISQIVLTRSNGKTSPLVLDDASAVSAKKWSPAEASCTADSTHVKSGKTSLRLHVDINWKTGELKYPIGWPRMSRSMPDGCTVRDKSYTEYDDGKPPPVWTCPLSQDAVVSDQPSEFSARVKPGKYNAWVLCGLSNSRGSQFYDFDIVSGSEKQRIQFENSFQYRHVFLKVDASDGKAKINFTPHSLFAICGVVLWQDIDTGIVQKEIIAPIRQITDFLPPDELKKWTLDQPLDTHPWPKIPTKDNDNGYLIFQKHWAECVYPNTIPHNGELDPEIQTFASLGEYEPLTFTIHPFRSFPSVTVKISDLKCGKNVISASTIDIRRVRYLNARPNYTTLHVYRVVPDVLMPYEPSPLVSDENTTFWLTVHVPDNAKP